MINVRRTRLIALAAGVACGLGGCASGTYAGFSAAANQAASPTAGPSQSADASAAAPPAGAVPPAENAPGNNASRAAGRSDPGAAAPSAAVSTGADSRAPASPGRGRVLYVSGNTGVAMAGIGGRARAGLSIGSGAAGASFGGVRVKAGVGGGLSSIKEAAIKDDPLGRSVAGAGGSGSGSADTGPLLAQLGKGKPVLGSKGQGGVLGGVGRSAGSLIGSGSQDAGSATNLITGIVAGGRHRRPLI